MRLALALLVASLVLPTAASQTPGATRFVVIITQPWSSPPQPGVLYEFAITNIGAGGERGVGSVFSLTDASNATLDERGAVADHEHSGDGMERLNVTFPAVRFPREGSYHVRGPESFDLQFDVRAPPAAQPSGGPRIVDAANGLVDGRDIAVVGEPSELVVTNLTTVAGVREAGAVLSITAPNGTLIVKRGAVDDAAHPGRLNVTFPAGALGSPGPWVLTGPGGLRLSIHVDPPEATAMDESLPRVIVRDGVPDAALSRGVRTNLVVGPFAFDGTHDVMTPYTLRGPAGSAVNVTSAAVAVHGEHDASPVLVAIFRGVALDRYGDYTVSDARGVLVTVSLPAPVTTPTPSSTPTPSAPAPTPSSSASSAPTPSASPTPSAKQPLAAPVALAALALAAALAARRAR